MAEKKFSELTSAATLTGSELVAVSQDQSGSLISAKTTTQGLSNFTAITAQYSSALQTTNKTICGAINEAAQSGGDTVTVTNTIPATSLTKKVADVNINGTPTAINADDALAVIKDVFGTDHTVEGNPVTFDAWTGIETVKACSVDLLPKQDLHGYESPWPGGARGNYLAGLKDGTYEGNGAKAVVKNGVATLSGTTTASGNALVIPLDKEVTLPNEQIYYHCMNSVANSNLGPSIEKNGQTSSTSISVALSPVNRIVEVNSVRWGVTVDQVRFYIGNGVTLSGTYAPMIMKTNTATDFIPYENICPISGRDSVEVKRTGKNLCNPANISVFNSNKYFSTTNYSTTPMIPVKASTQYVLSCRKGTPTAATADFRIYYWDSNDTIISNDRSNPFTTPSNCAKISFYVGYGDGDFTDGDNVKAQVEEGSTASAYESYQGETVTVSFGQTVYGGTLDVTNGKLTLDKGYTQFTSSDVWAISGAGSAVKTIADMKTLRAIEKAGICSKLKTDNGVNGCAQFGSNQGSNQLFIINARDYYGLDTVAKIQEFTDGMQICYPLATPIEITLTPEEISLLKGNNVVSTDGDNIILKYSADIGLYIAGQLQS